MNTKMPLLAAADSGKILNEVGTSFLKGLFGGNKPAPTPPQPKFKPEMAAKQKPSSLDEYLHQFIADLKGAPSGNDRYVIRMSLADLRAHYLKSGSGGTSYVETLTDEELSSFVKLQPKIQRLQDGYSFEKLMNSKQEVAVLLDIPTHLTADLSKAWSGTTDINGVKAALTKMMNHRFYVMTLSVSKMKKVASKISPIWDDAEELMNELDPTSIVVNYPDADDWTSIKRAFVKKAESNDDRRNREEEEAARKAEKENNKKEPDAAPPVTTEPARAPKAAEIKLGDLSPEKRADLVRLGLGRLRDDLIKRGISDKSIDDIAKALSDMV